MSTETIEPEYCNVAEGACVNPAGYQVGGLGGPCGDNDDPPRTRVQCAHCGDHACARCRLKHKGVWLCIYCWEQETGRKIKFCSWCGERPLKVASRCRACEGKTA